MKYLTMSNNELKRKVLKAKGELKFYGITQPAKTFILNYPEYDTASGYARVQNLLSTVITDEHFTNQLETLTESIKQL